MFSTYTNKLNNIHPCQTPFLIIKDSDSGIHNYIPTFFCFYFAILVGHISGYTDEVRRRMISKNLQKDEEEKKKKKQDRK